MRAVFPIAFCGFLSILTACGSGNSGGGNSTPPSYTVGGTLTGVAGSGLTLQINGAAMLALAGNGAFVFPMGLAGGTAYDLTIASQPTKPSQTCVLTHASGLIGNSNITDVTVSCTTNTYTVGGTVSGLSGSGLILQNNANDDLTLTANGSFSFTTPLEPGSAYLVTIKSQPVSPSQTCTVANASGTLASTDVTAAVIACTTNSFSVGGTVSGLVGTGLILELNGGDDFPVSANGSFTFAGIWVSGSNYAVTVKTQPSGISQTCALTNSPGTIGAAAVTNVSVTCTTNAYSVGGTITGLSGSDVVLQVNGSQDLTVSVNGSFAFPTPIASGTAYSVTIKTQPAVRHENCVATTVSGTIAAANVDNVTVNCSIFVGFVYAIDPDNSLAIYGISQTTGAPIPIGLPVSVGSNPTGVIAAPGGKFLYVASSTSNTVSVYAVDPNQGALTAVGLPVATGSQPTTMVFAPSGAYLFVSNFGDSTVSIYAVDGTSGLLTPVGNPLPLASGTWNSLAVTPNGKFLYVLSLLTGSGIVPTVTSVTAYAIDTATGALTAGPAIQPNADWLAMTMDPLGRFLYLDNVLSNGPYNSAIVLPYAIDSNTGALTAIGSGTSVGSATPNASNGVQMVAEPSGRYLYVISNFDLSATDDNIITLAVDPATGTLSQIGSQVALASDPFWAVCDPSGQFLFVSNATVAGHYGTVAANWNDVSAFTIGAIGAPAGQLSPSGQGAQFLPSVQLLQNQIERDTIAIVE